VVVDGHVQQVKAAAARPPVVSPERVEVPAATIRDAGEPLHIDVQQVARSRMLVADRCARHAVEQLETVQVRARQDAMDGGRGERQLPGNPERPAADWMRSAMIACTVA